MDVKNEKMKRDRLEDFVKANRGDFDFREPSPEVWSQIAKNSKPVKVVAMQTLFLKVAAVLTIAVISSVLVWETGVMGPGRMANNADPELLELMETEAFYSYQVDKKMEEIKKCYFTNPEVKDEIESDLNELESMYKVLKSELDENISNKSVIEAMIENNRFRLKLCDDVLDQLKC